MWSCHHSSPLLSLSGPVTPLMKAGGNNLTAQARGDERTVKWSQVTESQGGTMKIFVIVSPASVRTYNYHTPPAASLLDSGLT